MTKPKVVKAKSELRTLQSIGCDIIKCWRKDRPSQATIDYATPYLQALVTIDYTTDCYGLEYGDMIVSYLLNNLRGWRGEDARRIKAELQDHLDWHNGGSQ